MQVNLGGNYNMIEREELINQRRMQNAKRKSSTQVGNPGGKHSALRVTEEKSSPLKLKAVIGG